MKKITQISIAISTLFLIASCGNSSKDGSAAINDKKAAIEKLKADKTKTDEEIKKLQAELEKLDTNSANAAKIKLVSVTAVTTEDFKHFIDLQGKIDAENISYISPRMGPAQVKAVYVSQGQAVKKGQLLLKLDDAIMRQSVTAATQQLEGIKTQLGYARNLYQRQQNLWKEGIGTEVQLITAKTNVTSLENQLSAAGENIKTLQEQLKTANVYSDVTGIADIVAIRVGETFSGMSATGPQIKIVNTSSLKVVTNVPENYLTRIHKGSQVQIFIPDANKTVNSTISLISQAIDPTQRGFIAEAKIPYDAVLKPSQSAVVKILDYAAANAIVIPVNVIQSDETGKYVYVVSKSSNGKTLAHRVVVTIGEVYGEKVEIKAGLKAGDQLVTEGFQNLYEGQTITTTL
ncbi:MAG: efflux RND transporter periplasmic adaptor subunit [Chitinophagaceae bacterium]|nr:efflux RND transporter periplasmic adaptor subunit [Chitinophagaceae bacterium]MBK8785021.1 efflux RND transporter periplasmic adaptor subunit [Chitinophagaceae bacterium]MBK9484218.1 efflux RND transporter periplasmic adaptor subunit [Chitinophagaceae bacterium]MBL0198821.1 efflux RND transporter periplasmic adaptor subunit [Chitinophagaceae bacterium]